MREILFRGKDTLGNWLYGGFHLWKTRQPCVCNDELKPEEIKHIIIKNSFADWNMPRTMQPYEVVPETIGQYTGLTDKNGKKIFEGDIMPVYEQGEEYYYKVIYSGDCFMLAMLDSEQGSYPLSAKNAISEVIGNIHDNPELLKEREGK